METFNALLLCLNLCQLTLGQIDIRLPPSIIRGPRMHAIYRSDDKVTLDCLAQGIPDISYEWKKDNLDLNLNAANIKHGEGGTIIIDPTTSFDSGYYQCFAKNQYGVALTNTSRLQRAYIDSTTGSAVPQNVNAREGQPLQIQADPGKSFPLPTYGWENAVDAVDKNPVSLILSRRMQIDEKGDLYFSYVVSSDDLGGNIYKCTMYNPWMDVRTGGSYKKVTVTRVAGGVTPFAPTWSFSSAPQTVAVEGGNASLRCFFSGYPDPSMGWAGPGNTLPIGRYALNNFNTELDITNIQPTDEGDYVCSASNTQGQNKHTLQIRVEAKPRFASEADRPNNINVTEGNSVTFRCNIYAKPDPVIIWYRNGQILDFNVPPIRYVFSSDKKSLTIKNVCRNCDDRPDMGQTDLMVVQCNGSNLHGYAFGDGYLNVLTATKVNLLGDQIVSVDVNEEKEFRFECTATSDPSTPPTVTWYKIQDNTDYRVQEVPSIIGLQGGTLIVHLAPNSTKKWEMYAGKYKCVGNNGYSQDSVIVQINVKSLPGPATAGFETYWWILLLLLLILLFIIIVLCCCICLQRNKGDKYDVDDKERKNGNNPDKELKSLGFHEHTRPEGQTLRGSRGSLGSAGKVHSDDEEGSIMDYGDDDPGKFGEDGSFVGVYSGNTMDRKRGRME